MCVTSVIERRRLPLSARTGTRGLRTAITLWLMGHALASFGQTVLPAPQIPPQDLARKNGCLACHGMVHKQVGPGFAQVAARYRNDVEAQARLAGKIQHGSVGTWGRVIMPRQPLVTDADAQMLARWVLAQPPAP